MTAYDAGSGPRDDRLSTPPTWVRLLLGILMILAGLIVLGDVALATIISTIFIGAMAIATGAFEVVHAFWTRGWGGFLWQILLGLLYIAFGVVLLSQPLSGALILTYVFGLVFLLSGLIRILIGFSHWREAGWLMLLSGAFGVFAGLVILADFPKTALWVLGLLLGIDLISHGLAWLIYGWRPAAEKKD